MYQRYGSLTPLEDADGLWEVNYGSAPELQIVTCRFRLSEYGGADDVSGRLDPLAALDLGEQCRSAAARPSETRKGGGTGHRPFNPVRRKPDTVNIRHPRDPRFYSISSRVNASSGSTKYSISRSSSSSSGVGGGGGGGSSGGMCTCR